jgi:hypothetical protein
MGALLGIMLSAALGRYDSDRNCWRNRRKKAISRTPERFCSQGKRRGEVE